MCLYNPNLKKKTISIITTLINCFFLIFPPGTMASLDYLHHYDVNKYFKSQEEKVKCIRLFETATLVVRSGVTIARHTPGKTGITQIKVEHMQGYKEDRDAKGSIKRPQDRTNSRRGPWIRGTKPPQSRSRHPRDDGVPWPPWTG